MMSQLSEFADEEFPDETSARCGELLKVPQAYHQSFP
jgi:hypothetical protein